jgi:BASS family bile acid:Na+ symporter
VTVAQLIPLVAQVSMALIMFAVGLEGSFDEVGYLLRRPGLLVRSLLAMNIVMPVFALALAVLFDLNHVLEVTLFALALAPVPPILPNKQLKAGGHRSYVIGLLIASALFSVAFVPAAAHIAGLLVGRTIDVSPLVVGKIVATSMLLPLLAGVCVRLAAPALAARIARPLSLLGTVLLVLVFVPILVAQWRAILALLGNFTLVVSVVFVGVGLAVGHSLGGPNPDERTVLALSTATRHPAVALVLLVGAVVSGPYVKWRRQRLGGTGGAPNPAPHG